MRRIKTILPILLISGFSAFSQNYYPYDYSKVNKFVDAMVLLNEDLESHPSYLLESIRYFGKYQPRENGILFLKALFAHPITLQIIKDKPDMISLKREVERYPFNPERIQFTSEICDFKPFYLSRLAYERGFHILRWLYEETYTSPQIDCGLVQIWKETADHNLVFEVRNSLAYKGPKYYVINLSDPVNISFSRKADMTDPDIKYFNLAENRENQYSGHYMDEKEIEKFMSGYDVPRSHNVMPLKMNIKKYNFTILLTDAGLSIYDNKTKSLLKFFKNFYSLNGVE